MLLLAVFLKKQKPVEKKGIQIIKSKTSLQDPTMVEKTSASVNRT
jgi:hypothetical protein